MSTILSTTPHTFAPHLWKKGICRECGQSESDPKHESQNGKARAAAGVTVPPPIPTVKNVTSVPPPPKPPAVVAVGPPPIPTQVATPSEGFRKPVLSGDNKPGPLGRVTSLPPPLPVEFNFPVPPSATSDEATVAAFASIANALNQSSPNKQAPSSVMSELEQLRARSPVPPQRKPPPPPARAAPPPPTQLSRPPPIPATTAVATSSGPPPVPATFKSPVVNVSSPVTSPEKLIPPPIPAVSAKIVPPPIPVTTPVATPPSRPPPVPIAAVTPTHAKVVPPPTPSVAPQPPIPSATVAASAPPPLPLPSSTTTTAATTIKPPPLPTTVALPPPIPAAVSVVSTAIAPTAPVPPLPSTTVVAAASPAIMSRTAANRLVDYFAIFGRGGPIIDDYFSADTPIQEIRYQSMLLPSQRFPPTNYRDSELSGNTNNFCFPSDITLQLISLKDIDDQYSASFLSRRPRLHRFVLTKLDGSKQFCATLTVWERMSQDEIERMLNEIELEVRKRKGEDASFKLADFLASLRASLNNAATPATLFTPKALTLVSSWPFFTLWEEFLRGLYRISHCGLTEGSIRKQAKARVTDGSLPSIETNPSAFSLIQLSLPIERLLSHFMYEIPVPPPGVLQIRYFPPGSSKDQPPVMLSRPPINHLPLCDVNWHLIFRSIDHATFIAIFVAAATEQKVLLVSRHRNLITAVCDAISVLLFPFHWAGVYMPLLPEPMLEFLYAPVPFIAGISSSTYEARSDEIPDEIVLVELDLPRIRIPDADTLPQLPESMYNKLLGQLKEHANILNKNHVLIRLSDQAFPFGQDLYKLDVPEELAVTQPNDSSNNESSSTQVAPIVPAAYQALSTAFEPVQTYKPIQRRGSIGPFPTPASQPVSLLSPSTTTIASTANSAGGSDETALHIEEVRYGFLRLWCKLLARYEKYMPWGENANVGLTNSSGGGGSSSGRAASPTRNGKASSPPASPRSQTRAADAASLPQPDWFNTPAFLAAAPRDARPFLTLFTQTQLFAKFIDDRIILHDDIQNWNQNKKSTPSSSNNQATSSSNKRARLGAMSDNEDDTDSENEREPTSKTIVEGEENENGGADIESTEVSRGHHSKYSMNHSMFHHKPNQNSLSSSTNESSYVPSGGGAHSRPGSWIPDGILNSKDLLSDSTPSTTCLTVSPPTPLSIQIDSASPTSMPILHQIQFFSECILAKKNRRRQKLIGSIASGRIFGGKQFHPTPFLHDTTTEKEKMIDTLPLDMDGLPKKEYGYPTLRSTKTPMATTAVFPVFPTLDSGLFGEPRSIPNFNAPSPVIPTPMVATTAPSLAAVLKEASVPTPITITAPVEPTPSPTKSVPSLPPPGRSKLPPPRPIPAAIAPITPTSTNSNSNSNNADSHESSPPISPRSRTDVPSYVRATPASERTVVGARGSFASFRAQTIQSKINQMASLLSFDTFQPPSSSGVSPMTGKSRLPPAIPENSSSSSTVLPPRPPPINNNKLHTLMEKERAKQEQFAKKLTKEAAESPLNKNARSPFMQHKKTPTIWTPPVYNNKNSSTTPTPTKSAMSSSNTPAASTSAKIFSFAPSVVSGLNSSNFTPKPPPSSHHSTHSNKSVGMSISSPVLSSPISSPVMNSTSSHSRTPSSLNLGPTAVSASNGPPPIPSTIRSIGAIAPASATSTAATPPPIPSSYKPLSNGVLNGPPPIPSSFQSTPSTVVTTPTSSSVPIRRPPPVPLINGSSTPTNQPVSVTVPRKLPPPIGGQNLDSSTPTPTVINGIGPPPLPTNTTR